MACLEGQSLSSLKTPPIYKVASAQTTRKVKLVSGGVMMSTAAWLKETRMEELQWPSQSPDLSRIETLWWDLKAEHKQMPANLNELKQCCKEEWDKIRD